MPPSELPRAPRTALSQVVEESAVPVVKTRAGQVGLLGDLVRKVKHAVAEADVDTGSLRGGELEGPGPRDSCRMEMQPVQAALLGSGNQGVLSGLVPLVAGHTLGIVVAAGVAAGLHSLAEDYTSSLGCGRYA
mmetsp:Transcript_38949/g.52810  ORF Transcript_38949/g.52810 Transcript_38949/m.52810 type:complete len:133 (+) Transcript_38949:3287-3685(+)